MRRHGSLRRHLTVLLVGLSLSSVLILGTVASVMAKQLLDGRVERQLTGLLDARVEAIERGVANLETRVATLVTDPAVITALDDLARGFAQLDEDLSPDELEALNSLHEQEVLALYDEAGVEHPPVQELVPSTTGGRYLQQQYLVRNPFPAEDRADLDDAGDGSAYSAAHALHHPRLRELMATTPASDLAFVSADTRDVIYTVAKRTDFGTNALEGPFAAAGVGQGLYDRLSRSTAGDAVMIDSEFFLPAGSEPMAFVAAAVRDDNELIGAVIIQIPIEVLTTITTAGGRFEDLGLGDTGETYVVGADRRLRSDARLWVEDPAEYLRRLRSGGDAERLAELIEFVGSPALLQPVDNDAVGAALDGEQFSGRVTSYLGHETVAAAGPVDAADLDWAVVVEQATAETDRSVDTFVRRMLLLLAVLLPIVAIAGVWLAGSIARSITPVVSAARRIAEGDLDIYLPDPGNNEIGDVARELDAVAHTLRNREAAIAAEETRIVDMLSAVLPSRLIERVRRGERGITDLIETAAIVSLTVDGLPEHGSADQDALVGLSADIASVIDELTVRHRVERVGSSSDHPLFLAELGDANEGADRVARFALDVREAIHAVGSEHGVELGARAGVAAGDVAAGLIGSAQLSFEIWGEPPRRAATLSSLAAAGEVLADAAFVGSLVGSWDHEPVDELVVLSGEAIEAFSISGPSDHPDGRSGEPTLRRTP